jgi:hypothetical protein
MLDQDKDYLLDDSFEGLPPTTENYGDSAIK